MTDYINPARKIAYHAAHIAALQEGRVMPPINVEIDLTNRCSLGCRWCHFAYTHTKGPLAGKRDKPAGAVAGGDVMDIYFACDILAQLRAYGVQSVTWTGGGEPTLHPRFSDIIRYCGLPQGVYTHGGLVGPSLAEVMKERCEWVYVSLDECTREDYKASKGVDGFDHATQGISYLVSAPGDAVIGVGFLLHEGNYHKAREMHALALELGADYVQFRPTVYYDMAEPSKLAPDDDWIMHAWDIVRRLEKAEKVAPNSRRFLKLAAWKSHGYDTCHWSAMQTVITPNGRVWTCVNKREHPAALLGDLTRETFEDIWARRVVASVDRDCRVMCRGHEGNVALNEILTRPTHAEFP